MALISGRRHVDEILVKCPFVEENGKENRKMGHLDNGTVKANVLPERHGVPKRTQCPCQEIYRGNVGEQGLVLDKRDGVDSDQELMF